MGKDLRQTLGPHSLRATDVKAVGKGSNVSVGLELTCWGLVAASQQLSERVELLEVYERKCNWWGWEREGTASTSHLQLHVVDCFFS